MERVTLHLAHRRLIHGKTLRLIDQSTVFKCFKPPQIAKPDAQPLTFPTVPQAGHLRYCLGPIPGLSLARIFYE